MVPPRMSTRQSKPRIAYDADPFDELDLSPSSSEVGSPVEKDKTASSTPSKRRRVRPAEAADSDSDGFATPDSGKGAQSSDDGEFDQDEEEEDDSPPGSEPEASSDSELDTDRRGVGRLKGAPKSGILIASRHTPAANIAVPRREVARAALKRDKVDRGRSQLDFNQKDIRYAAFFGTGADVIAAAFKTRDKWGEDATLPSRAPSSSGVGGFAMSPFFPRADRDADRELDWAWYEAGGQAMFASLQQITSLDASIDRALYIETSQTQSVEILLGAISSMKKVAIDPLQSVDTGVYWATKDADYGPRGKHSWIVNAGRPVLHSQWLPNQPSKLQYLSLLTKPTAQAEALATILPPKVPTAYQRVTGAASIQVWRFSAIDAETHANNRRPDYDTAPELDVVLCSDHGTFRQVRWCPFPRNEDAISTQTGDRNRWLGLLAVVCGDGQLRVYDVSVPLFSAGQTIFLKLAKPVFETSASSLPCTAVEWLSSSLIGVGDVSGFVSIWDLSDTDNATGKIQPLPFFYNRLHSSYIVAILCLAPSRPHLLVTTSVDGYIRLTDIHNPHSDFISVLRVVLIPPFLAWSDHTQCVIVSHTRNFIEFVPIRNFGGAFKLYWQHSPVACAATSPWHTALLSSGTDGEVILSNPVSKIFQPKHNQTIIQPLFLHEQQSTATPPLPVASSTEQADSAQPPDAPSSAPAWAPSVPPSHPDKKRVVRFIEGFPAEATAATRPKPVNSKNDTSNAGQGSSNTPSLAAITAAATKRDNYMIFESGSAVNSVAWNGNRHVAGWMASGMESGLVRVQDLGI